MRPSRPISLLVCFAMLPALAGRTASAQGLQVLNLDYNGQLPNQSSKEVDISGNGRYVVFTSNYLLAGETAPNQVYLRDLRTGSLELISVAAGGGDADQPCYLPMYPNQTAVSDDGRYVVFRSTAGNLLSPSIGGGTFHVYRRDRQLQVTELMSADSAGNPANGSSGEFSMSPDGGVVIFNSTATNLDVLDSDGTLNTFVHETTTDTTRLACFDAVGDKIDDCRYIAIACGGGAMVFESSADGVAPGDSNGWDDLYVGVPLDGDNELLTQDYNGTPASFGDHGYPSISCDGQRIAFSTSFDMTFEDTDGLFDLYVVNHVSDQVWRILDGNSNPVRGLAEVQISSNGGWVAFGSNQAMDPVDTNGFGDFYRLDFTDTNVPGAVTLISQNAGQVANGANWSASVSDHGDVVFSSSASNLAPFPDNKGFADVFARVEPLFADGFESGDPSAWSASTGFP